MVFSLQMTLDEVILLATRSLKPLPYSSRPLWVVETEIVGHRHNKYLLKTLGLRGRTLTSVPEQCYIPSICSEFILLKAEASCNNYTLWCGRSKQCNRYDLSPLLSRLIQVLGLVPLSQRSLDPTNPEKITLQNTPRFAISRS